MSAQEAYNVAVSDGATATTNFNDAQAAVDAQQPIRDAVYQNLQTKQNNLDIANINLSVAQSNGQPATNSLSAYLYDCWTLYNLYNNMPPLGCPAGRGQGIPISMGPWSTINFNFGGGGPAGLYDDYQIKWTGYIKSTAHWTPQFRTCGDDGMIVIINGNMVRNDWYDRGGGCAASTGYYMANDGWIPIEVWWYENGGGAWGQLQWDFGKGFQVISSSNFSESIPQQDPTLQDKIAAQQLAQSEYDDALFTYDVENNKLIEYNQTLQTSQENLTLANENITTATQNLTIAQGNYEIAIAEMQIAIINAQTEYNNQLDFENKQRVAAAIAQALANQPQPEPTIEPSPNPTTEPSPSLTTSPEPDPSPTVQPSPEQTSTSNPTPTPEPSPSKDESSPSPEPNPTPSPTPTQIETTDPEPTPEPTPSTNEITSNDTTEDILRKLSDLTNKDTLTKLTPEQKQAVANTLGIKTEEIALIAQLAKEDPAIAKAVESFAEKAAENKNAPMPYTLADAITESQTEEFLSNPIGAVFNINPVELLSNFSELGMDMTDDQREKAQEVIIPVVLVSNIVSAVIGMRR